MGKLQRLLPRHQLIDRLCDHGLYKFEYLSPPVCLLYSFDFFPFLFVDCIPKPSVKINNIMLNESRDSNTCDSYVLTRRAR